MSVGSSTCKTDVHGGLIHSEASSESSQANHTLVEVDHPTGDYADYICTFPYSLRIVGESFNVH